jgi:hypothetical protein
MCFLERSYQAYEEEGIRLHLGVKVEKVFPEREKS